MGEGSSGSLQHLIDRHADFAGFLYNDAPGPRGHPSPVPAEFTNWREEQRAWRETAVLFDRSNQMFELRMTGPDAFRLLDHVGIGGLEGLAPGRARRLVGCNPRGQLIGDCVLHDLGNATFALVGGMPLLDWVAFQALSGGYRVAVERDDPATGPANFRFVIDGPDAGRIFGALVEGQAPRPASFRTASVWIAGCAVLALGQDDGGIELSGPWEKGPVVRAAILAAGSGYGLRCGGAKACLSRPLESGRIAVVPAIYTGEDLRPFREWLPETAREAELQLGGSFVSPDIEDYYATPFDLGYAQLLDFDRDFIGREALARMAGRAGRRKVTLVWSRQHASEIFDSLLEPGLPYKYVALPVADYAAAQRDAVQDDEGNLVGLSVLSGYSANETQMLSLAMVDSDHAEPGTELTLVWGEPDGGSRKPRVERHFQKDVSVTVAPCPYVRAVPEIGRAPIRRPACRAVASRWS